MSEGLSGDYFGEREQQVPESTTSDPEGLIVLYLLGEKEEQIPESTSVDDNYLGRTEEQVLDSSSDSIVVIEEHLEGAEEQRPESTSAIGDNLGGTEEQILNSSSDSVVVIGEYLGGTEEQLLDSSSDSVVLLGEYLKQVPSSTSANDHYLEEKFSDSVVVVDDHPGGTDEQLPESSSDPEGVNGNYSGGDEQRPPDSTLDPEGVNSNHSGEKQLPESLTDPWIYVGVHEGIRIILTQKQYNSLQFPIYYMPDVVVSPKTKRAADQKLENMAPIRRSQNRTARKSMNRLSKSWKQKTAGSLGHSLSQKRKRSSLKARRSAPSSSNNSPEGIQVKSPVRKRVRRRQSQRYSFSPRLTDEMLMESAVINLLPTPEVVIPTSRELASPDFAISSCSSANSSFSGSESTPKVTIGSSIERAPKIFQSADLSRPQGSQTEKPGIKQNEAQLGGKEYAAGDRSRIIMSTTTWLSGVWKGRDKPHFTCEYCDAKYEHKFEFTAHLYKHRKEEEQELAVTCSVCSVRFHTVAALQDHYNRNVHGQGTMYLDSSGNTEIRRFRCPKCPCVFVSETYYKMHLAIHDRPKHVCSVCSEEFTYEIELTDHLKMEHKDWDSKRCELTAVPKKKK